MVKQLIGLASAVVIVGSAASARAQDGMLWLEGGQQKSAFGSGIDRSGAAAGGGFLLTIGGTAKKNTGVIIPVGMETKFSQGADMLFTGDIGIRVGPVSFGPGAGFGFMLRSNVADSRCLSPQPANNSCFAPGSDGKATRDIGGFIAIAPSGFAKVSFGPQSRAFLQGRYVHYMPGLMTFLSYTEMTAAFNSFSESIGSNAQAVQTREPFHPVDFPEFKTGHDVRISTGYMFGGADKKMKVLRVQYSLKEFTFTGDKANSNGIFNQKTNQFTVGVGLAF